MSDQGNHTYRLIKRKILFAALEKYGKDTPSNAIAKILYRDYPEFFTSKEMARGHIRLYRGKSGKDHRNTIVTTKYYKNEKV